VPTAITALLDKPIANVAEKKNTYRSFATRVSQLKIWQFLVIGYRKKYLEMYL